MPFRLEPNETYFVDVAYTPDFLMAVNEAALQLYMHMNGTPWVFFMGATLPRHMLGLCHAALPRPPFEIIMRYLCLTALLFCLICVVACSYLEGDRMITCAIRQQYTQERTVFDLNAIAASVNQGNSLQTPEKPPDIRPTVIDTRRKRTHYVTIDPDANIFTRSFWASVNWVLWVVSPVWVAVRSDSHTTQSKSKRKKQKRSVTSAQIVDQTTPQTFMQVEPLSNKIATQNEHIISHTNHVEKSEPNNIARQENKELPTNDINANKVYTHLNDLDKIRENHILPNKHEAETELRLRKTIKTMDGNLDRPISNKQTNHVKQEALPNDLHIDNIAYKNNLAKKKRERRTSKSDDKPEKAPAPNPTLLKAKPTTQITSDTNTYNSRHSSAVSGTDYEDRTFPLQTDEDEEAVDPVCLSDSNEMPEWADDSGVPIADDIEELYDELVTTSAVLFTHSRDSSPAAASSLSHSPKENTFVEPIKQAYTKPIKQQTKKKPPQKETSDGTDNSKASLELTKKRKKRHQQRPQKGENSEIIAKLMTEYHEYLQEALASGKKPEELLPPKVQLSLPDDLSSNGFDQKVDWDDMKNVRDKGKLE
uniref:Uncharacterized protein n=1 Tax=Acrobeloides nanus TaxID=290746 RepID=A0A914CWU0_9BILA